MTEDQIQQIIDLARLVERERLAQVVRDFPNWIGPKGKRELLAAMGVTLRSEEGEK